MNPFEHSLRNAQCDVPSLVAWTQLSDHKDSRLVLEKLTNFIRTQVPHFGNFRNGVVPFGRGRGFDLGQRSHWSRSTPPTCKGYLGRYSSRISDLSSLPSFSGQSRTRSCMTASAINFCPAFVSSASTEIISTWTLLRMGYATSRIKSSVSSPKDSSSSSP